MRWGAKVTPSIFYRQTSTQEKKLLDPRDLWHTFKNISCTCLNFVKPTWLKCGILNPMWDQCLFTCFVTRFAQEPIYKDYVCEWEWVKNHVDKWLFIIHSEVTITWFYNIKPSKNRYSISTNLSSRVSHLNPRWNDPNPDSEVCTTVTIDR